MDPDVRRQNCSEKIHTPDWRKKLWHLGVPVLSCLVALGAALALILPAATLSADVFCGLEEHTHGPECWGQRLACGLEEAPLKKEGPSEEDQPEDGLLEDEQPEEEQPEGEEPLEEKAHVHTEQCYETVLVCGMEAHVHDLWCYADPQADLETPDIWQWPAVSWATGKAAAITLWVRMTESRDIPDTVHGAGGPMGTGMPPLRHFACATPTFHQMSCQAMQTALPG